MNTFLILLATYLPIMILCEPKKNHRIIIYWKFQVFLIVFFFACVAMRDFILDYQSTFNTFSIYLFVEITIIGLWYILKRMESDFSKRG